MPLTPGEYFTKCLQMEFPLDVRRRLDSATQFVTFRKGQVPVRQGDQMDAFFFLMSGLVRGYYLDKNGSEVTKCFSQENQFFSSECFRTRETSSFFIECMEDCSCIRVPYSLVRVREAISRNINVLYLQEIARLERRLKNLLLLDTEERYLLFCREYPGLQNRVPLKYIASYIGIQAGSISRIRKKLRNSPIN